MLFVGIDDTDIAGSAGTNQLARRIASVLPKDADLVVILRHQLLFDPRIPYTSKNGCASIGVRMRHASAPPASVVASLASIIRREMQAWYVSGSDPGLCVADEVQPSITAFGKRCQREPVTQHEARVLAADAGIHLEGLGGTEDGVIGALAAVGLLAGGGDGRVVHLPGWTWPDPFAGAQTAADIRARGVWEVRDVRSGAVVPDDAVVDVGKHLRPSYRAHRVVLFAERCDSGTAPWRAVKLA